MSGGSRRTGFFPANLAGWLDLFVKTAAVFAGIFAVYQFLQARHELRVARSLGYIERFDDLDTSVGRARAAIGRALWANEEQLLRLQDAMRTLPPDQARALRDRFVDKLHREVRAELNDVVDFFEGLFICIDTELCDAAAAHAYFCDYATTLWGNFAGPIRERRELDRNYGAGLEHLVHQAAEGPICPDAGDEGV